MSDQPSTDISTEVDPEALTAAVAQSHASPAPADPLEQDINSVVNRVAALERALATETPTPAPLSRLESLEDIVAQTAPSTAPFISRLEQLEAWALGMVEHFQGKVPPVPPAK